MFSVGVSARVSGLLGEKRSAVTTNPIIARVIANAAMAGRYFNFFCFHILFSVNHNFIAVYTYIKCFNSKMQAVLCNFISVRVAIVPVRENSL